MNKVQYELNMPVNKKASLRPNMPLRQINFFITDIKRLIIYLLLRSRRLGYAPKLELSLR